MKSIITIFLFTIFTNFCYSQKNDVSIIEENTKKRTFLYAENKSNIPKHVFLKVDATGYRRRSDRPLIETIPPNSKKLLITLIPLSNVESKYTYKFIVNDEEENIHAINNKPKKVQN